MGLKTANPKFIAMTALGQEETPTNFRYKIKEEAGRKLFNVSRLNKKSANDSHRLKQILAKYDLSFEDFHSD